MSVLATRKPRLLFRFVGSFLLRLAERRFCGLLFQEPPRLTRLEQGACQGEIILPKQCSADSPGRPNDIVGQLKKSLGLRPKPAQ